MARNGYDWEAEGLTQEDFKLKKGQGVEKPSASAYHKNDLLGKKKVVQQTTVEQKDEYIQQQPRVQQSFRQEQREQPLFHENRTVQLQEDRGHLARAQEVEIGGTNARLAINKTILPEKARMEEASIVEIPKSQQYQMASQKVVTVPTKEVVEVPSTEVREFVEKKIIEVPSKKTINVPTTTYVEVPTTKIVPVQTMKQVEVETTKKIEIPVTRTETVQTTRQVEIPGSKQVLVDSHDVVEINQNATGIQSKTVGISDVNVLPPNYQKAGMKGANNARLSQKELQGQQAFSQTQ